MHLGRLCGLTVGIAGLAAPAAALSNTSPFVLLSDSRMLRADHDAGLAPSVPSMADTLNSVAAGAALSCGYDAYIFVKHPHVSERDVSPRTMPWLAHAAAKVSESVLLSTVLDGASADADAADAELQRNIAQKCGAQTVAVDAATGAFPPYSDTASRILPIDFSGSGKTPSEVDTVLRDLVGHLPSANFLFTYRTTPVETDAREPAPHSAAGTAAATRPAAHAAASAADVPYESVFRNYQFFTPGIFMGLIGSGLALAALLVALRAVDSLQISPAAFEPRRQTLPRKSN